MRIIIDLQGAQSLGSRNRGIGRYARALAHGIINNRGSHEVLLALNGAFPETIDSLVSEFSDSLGRGQIRIWSPPATVHFADPHNDTDRQAAEAYREYFLASLNPDVIHISSLFEGFGDSSVVSIGSLPSQIPTTVTLYDLIPLIFGETYFQNPRFEQWYRNRLGHLLRADRLLAISESSRQEAIDYLHFDPRHVTAVGTAADAQFKPCGMPSNEISRMHRKFGLNRPFVLYTGGIDPRKNIDSLIKSYAALPRSITKEHQLAIVCSIEDSERSRLRALAKDFGLTAHDVIFTGFIPESHLISLYSSCKLFVFPSLHEGFGLPALEAMNCGARVIASDRSSLPEVVALREALFDPYNEQQISSAIERGLTDEDFRTHLQLNAIDRSSQFSWEKSAKLAIGEMESLVSEKKSSRIQLTGIRPRLAFVSPFRPARSGIADYSSDLLQYLSKYYDIDLIQKSNSPPIDDKFASGFLTIVSEDAFKNEFAKYDRILYHFGNSDHHDHMFQLLEATGGVVVLHDFYLSGIIAHCEWHTQSGKNSWRHELYRSHGYPALQHRRDADPESETVWKYPCSWSVINAAARVIVHSENSVRLAREWYGAEAADKFSVVPLLRTPVHESCKKSQARSQLGLGKEDFVVCSFGLLGSTKLNHRLIEAWKEAGLSKEKNCHLVFVGMNDEGPYGQRLLDEIQQSALQNVNITGWAESALYEAYLQAADAGVQLRAKSRGETSAAALDCLNHGLSLIVNANGSMGDLPAEIVTILPDQFETAELARALKRLRAKPAQREAVRNAAVRYMREIHSPDVCARLYFEAIEGAYTQVQQETAFITKLQALKLESDFAAKLAESWDREILGTRKRLFVDISQLAQFDARSGIQRVVRSLLKELVVDDSLNLVEPIYYCNNIGRYRYARCFMEKFLCVDIGDLSDEIADIRSGDDLLCLDLNPIDVHNSAKYLKELRNAGVIVSFVVYDLLPLRHPDCFVPGAADTHRAWLDVVLSSDRAICISQAVADDLSRFIEECSSASTAQICSFPLGADFLRYPDDRGALGNGGAHIGSAPTFLMVGTLEPRKGHGVVLDAFERLWADGNDARLVIVGKQGWLVEELVERIRTVSSAEPRLTWLNDADDKSLADLYRDATCLIVASRDEGFGLPIIEAAQYGLPVLARDIPVFREVASTWATYFPANVDGIALASCILSWLERRSLGANQNRELPKITSWKESADALKACLATSIPVDKAHKPSVGRRAITTPRGKRVGRQAKKDTILPVG